MGRFFLFQQKPELFVGRIFFPPLRRLLAFLGVFWG
jgi:hypothetical protein